MNVRYEKFVSKIAVQEKTNYTYKIIENVNYCSMSECKYTYGGTGS